jgi:hypothetical protein
MVIKTKKRVGKKSAKPATTEQGPTKPTPQQMSPKVKGALVILIALFAIYYWVARGDRSVSSPSSAGHAEPASPVSPAAQAGSPVGESCLELAAKFGTSSKLSDLQKEEAWKQYRGRPFSWQLSVTEVSSDMLGGFTVQYKCSPQSPSLIQDIQLKYQDSAKGFVMNLQKGQSYQIKGKLGASSTLFGMTGDGTL